jgi:hypothetical protein
MSSDDTAAVAVPSQPFVIGWEEWLSLPGLNLPAIKAKIDTGAKTSALHAFLIEPFNEGGRAFVRFGIHPIPGRDGIEIFCTSPLVDRREITSSNGDKEARYVISTPVSIGGRTWDIEVTLTNRHGMAYRMLLGRQAIRDGLLVDPAASFLQPRLSHKLYGRKTSGKPGDAVAQAPGQTGSQIGSQPGAGTPNAASGLRLAVITRQPASSSNRRLAEAAAKRGHTLVSLDLAALTLPLGDTTPGVFNGGDPVGRFDYSIPRFLGGNGAFGAGIVRRLECDGCFSLNSGDALDLLRNPLALAQRLGQAGARQTSSAVTDSGWADQLKAASKATPELSVLAVGGKAIAAIGLQTGATTEVPRHDARADFALAERIAATLDLGLASVDFGADDDGRVVVRVSGCPRLGLYERITGARVADAILNEIEARARLAASLDDEF